MGTGLRFASEEGIEKRSGKVDVHRCAYAFMCMCEYACTIVSVRGCVNRCVCVGGGTLVSAHHIH